MSIEAEFKQHWHKDVANFVNHMFPSEDIFTPRMPDKPLKEQPFLEDLVSKDMVSEGYNPLNRLHVNKFWRDRGIEVYANI